MAVLARRNAILPVLEVESDGAKRTVTILQAKWEGLRLRVNVASGADLSVDLRHGSEISGPSLIKGRSGPGRTGAHFIPGERRT